MDVVTIPKCYNKNTSGDVLPTERTAKFQVGTKYPIPAASILCFF